MVQTINQEKLLQYLIDQGLTDEQIQKQYDRAIKLRKDKILQVRLSLYDYLLIKDNPCKMIRSAIRMVYGRKECAKGE